MESKDSITFEGHLATKDPDFLSPVTVAASNVIKGLNIHAEIMIGVSLGEDPRDLYKKAELLLEMSERLIGFYKK